MSNIEKYFRYGFIEFNVTTKPILNNPLICVNNGIWYKFNIDEISQLNDGTYNVRSNTLIGIDDKLVK